MYVYIYIYFVDYILKVGGPLCPQSRIVIGQLCEDFMEEESLPESDLAMNSVEKNDELQEEEKKFSGSSDQNAAKETMYAWIFFRSYTWFCFTYLTSTVTHFIADPLQK